VANAVKLAVDEWNRKGGVLGKKIEVLEADDQGNPQIGVSAAEKVAADAAVLGAVWGITSVTCIPVSEVLDRVNLVMVSPGCTNPKVTARGLKNLNRTCARDDARRRRRRELRLAPGLLRAAGKPVVMTALRFTAFPGSRPRSRALSLRPLRQRRWS
jgi:hypothetical protein